MNRFHPAVVFCAGLLVALAQLSAASEPSARTKTEGGAKSGLFAKKNLFAWCVVPFDAKKRGPEERAAMLEGLGLHALAYDYRAEHVPTFDAEMDALKRHHIQLLAWWFPTELNDEARLILDVLKRHHLKTQLWVMGGGEPTKNDEEQRRRVESEAARIRTIAEAAAKIGCTVGLYNHGSWFGEPANQIQIIERLRQQGIRNVGIVYNLHHGHRHLDDFAEVLRAMKPYLLALNLNGMTRNGGEGARKIMPLGQGELDLHLLRVIRESGWDGPIGILNHTDEDAEGRLRDNLSGLEWLVARLNGQAPGPKPQPRTWQEPSSAYPFDDTGARAGTPGDLWAVGDAKARAALPEYVEIPGARAEELTAAVGWPRVEAMTNWHRSHGDATSSRYSALKEINKGNVNQLRVAWTYHSKDGTNNIQCNPIVVDGLLVTPTPGHQMVAINAETGEERWRFRPEMPKSLRQEDPPARRGLVYWGGEPKKPKRQPRKLSGSRTGAVQNAGARILFAAGDWIYALEPKTGKPIATFGENGRTRIATGGTVAGAVFRNVFVIAGFHRDVFGYDVRDGSLLWTFHTVPQPGEFGHETWSSTLENRKGWDGANCWGGLALDEQRGIVFIATSSPKPDFDGTRHRGNNLFSNCVLALDALTGERWWHFQELRHGIWDIDLPAPPNLVTIMREGRRVDAVAQVTKLGNTLLLDRETGQPIFQLRMRRAPTSKLPGEWTAPYQPAPQLPEPFCRQVFTRDEVTTRSEESRDFIEKRIANANFGWCAPFEEAKPTIVFNIHGGAEWTGAAFDPTSGRLYISANELPWAITVFTDDPEPPRDPKNPTLGETLFQTNCASCHGPDRRGIGTAPPLRGLRHRLKDEEVLELLKTGRNVMPVAPAMSEEEQKALLDYLFLRDQPEWKPSEAKPERPAYTSGGYPKLLDQDGYPGCKPPWGTLNCLDLNTGKLRWQVPLGEYPELTAQGVPKTGTENFGGAIVTAGGLVFCSGTRDKKIRAFDKETGDELWSYTLPLHGTAPPATYSVNGRQFLVIPATGGGKLGGATGDEWVAFALAEAKGGKAPSSKFQAP
jgi:quinoprotein glucose dehydrogenase